MDILSYSLASKVKKWVQKFNANPGSDYGIVTTPTTIDNNETISIPANRQVVVNNMTVADGSTLEIADGAEIGVLGGGSLSSAVFNTDSIKTWTTEKTITTDSLVKQESGILKDIDGNRLDTITDDVTGLKYVLKISNGQLYIEETE